MIRTCLDLSSLIEERRSHILVRTGYRLGMIDDSSLHPKELEPVTIIVPGVLVLRERRKDGPKLRVSSCVSGGACILRHGTAKSCNDPL